MLPTIEYDFTELMSIFDSIKEAYTAKPDHLRAIRAELNKFFSDTECKDIMYTNNTDNMFFGIKVLPILDSDDIFEYLISDEPIRVEKYIVELDSNIFNPIVNLTSAELMSLLLHEVNGVVGDASPIENARNALNIYLSSNGEHIKISKSVHYKEILTFGLKDFMSKTNSIFYNFNPSETYADEFAAAYGFTDNIISAYTKLKCDNMRLYENMEVSKFIVFSWALSIYKNLRIRRVGSLHTLARAKDLTGSRIERMELDNIINRIKRIDDDTVIVESSDMMNTIRAKVKEKMRKSRINTLKLIDSTFYELNLQARNVEDEEDAIYLMRQINTNLSIIDEYRTSSDCDEYERSRWDQAFAKFDALREKLSNTITYKTKNFGIYVDYPDIVENRY